MSIFKAFLFLITLCVANSEENFETICKDDFRNEKNIQIDVLEYCSDKLCIQKCCGPDEVMFFNNYCRPNKIITGKVYSDQLKPQYDSINILSSDPSKTKQNFVFIQNKKYSDYLLNCTAEDPGLYDISEVTNYSFTFEFYMVPTKKIKIFYEGTYSRDK